VRNDENLKSEIRNNAVQWSIQNPLLTKEGWRNRASPIGRSLKRWRAGVVAHTERFVVSDHPSCAFSAASPPL